MRSARYRAPVTSVILAALGGAFLISLIGTGLVRILSTRLGWMDTPGAPGHHKRAVGRVPNTGGIAIYLAIVAPILAALGIAHLPNSDGVAGLFPSLVEHLPGVREVTPLGVALVAALSVLHALGLIDDRRALGAWSKLGVMTAVAGAIVALFPELRLLTVLDEWTGVPGLSFTLTVLWLVVVTNAMNFMDNMDGLCAGVAAVCAGCLLIGAWRGGEWFIACALALLVGACLGFLVLNAPGPRGRSARIYMGDGGSLVIGFLLAFLTVKATYLPESADAAASHTLWHAALMPVVVLAVPLYDFTTVTLIRIAQGNSPFKGDQQHFSHRLRARGLSVFQTLCVICACAAITGMGGLMLRSLHDWTAALVGVQTGLVLAVIAALEFLVPGPRGDHG